MLLEVWNSVLSTPLLPSPLLAFQWSFPYFRPCIVSSWTHAYLPFLFVPYLVLAREPFRQNFQEQDACSVSLLRIFSLSADSPRLYRIPHLEHCPETWTACLHSKPTTRASFLPRFSFNALYFRLNTTRVGWTWWPTACFWRALPFTQDVPLSFPDLWILSTLQLQLWELPPNFPDQVQS